MYPTIASYSHGGPVSMKAKALLPIVHESFAPLQAHEIQLLPGVYVPGYLFCHAHPNNGCTAFRQNGRDHSSRQPIC